MTINIVCFLLFSKEFLWKFFSSFDPKSILSFIAFLLFSCALRWATLEVESPCTEGNLFLIDDWYARSRGRANEQNLEKGKRRIRNAYSCAKWRPEYGDSRCNSIVQFSHGIKKTTRFVCKQFFAVINFALFFFWIPMLFISHFVFLYSTFCPQSIFFNSLAGNPKRWLSWPATPNTFSHIQR